MKNIKNTNELKAVNVHLEKLKLISNMYKRLNNITGSSIRGTTKIEKKE